jgi:WD40 repeat protein
VTPAPVDPWAVAIHLGQADPQPPIGSGVVVDTNLVLACEHVVCLDGRLRDDLWISFPRAPGVGYWDRRRVGQCLHNGRPEKNVDLVLLELVEPVPGSVAPARLRCLPPRDLVDKSWWAYGFPKAVEGGCAAQGTITAEGGWGRIRLSPDSGAGVSGGFSGAALWSPEYEAVVGIVVEAAQQTGDGQALTLAHADAQLPEMKLSTLAAWRIGDADDSALAAWGWTLPADDEAHRHWLPRARGVAADSEGGARFRGRDVALRRLVDRLDQSEPAGRPLIVTGSPGVGKSAVLGRIVTTADAGVRATLGADDAAVRATVDSVSCAVHVKGKTALEVAAEIARAAAVGLPAATVDLMPALRDRLAASRRRFNLVVDALDEAATPEHARSLINDVLVPLARTCGRLGLQVVVGTRRSDDLGDLLAGFGADADVVDLDAPEFFAESDLAEYAQATLQLKGAERSGNPYADEAVAAPVARRIATLANGNFLVAGLVARARALRDTEPVDPARVTFTATVADALDTYLGGLPDAGGAPARLALTVLAYAETPGLPIALWQVATEALGGQASEVQLSEFARTSAANFLVETGGAGNPRYRLFHQALNEALLANRDEVGARAQDERRLAETWIGSGRKSGWAAAPEYLLRSLSRHAARAGLVDDLLDDDGYLLHAHLDRLMRVTDAATSPSARSRVQLLQRTPAAIKADPATRAALFSVVDGIDQLGGGVDVAGAPYFARWADTPRRPERTVLEGHSQAVYDVCSIVVDGRHLLASAGEDGTVRLWDPLTNQNEHAFSCHADCIRGVSAVRVGTTSLLATASHDGIVGLWDPLTGLRVHELAGHSDWVRNLCAVPTPDGDLLASASDDRTVRLWDPATGTLRHTLTGHTGWATAVTHVPMRDHSLLASTGADGTIRLWDPLTGAELRVLRTGAGWITTLYAVQTAARTMLASAGYDGVIRLWDPATGDLLHEYATEGPLTDLCTVEADGVSLLVSTGEDGVIRLWDPESGCPRETLRGHSNWIRAVCELPIADRRLIATAGDDGTVRLWDPDGAVPGPIADSGRPGTVTTLCAVPLGDAVLVASAGADGSVRLWTPEDGAPRLEPLVGAGSINDMCVIDDGGPQLAAANEDGFVQLWDVDAGSPALEMTDHFDAVNAVCALRTDDGLIMVSAGDDVTVRLWNPHNGAIRGGLIGHGNWVTALAVVDRGGREALASGDKSGTVRLWDSSGGQLWDQPSHHDAITALCALTVEGRTVLVSASADRHIGLWNCADGRRLMVLSGHTAPVTGVCAVPVRGRELLASTSLDRTVRLWDPLTARAVLTIPVHHQALACCYVGDTLVLGLDQGLLALAIRG